MARYNNPFLTRFSDKTGMKNTVFLAMYAPQVINTILKNEDLLSPKATWFVGIPGSGKSSILRLFSIEILNTIKKQKETYSHLYDPLVEAGIINDNVIKTVGVYVQIDEIFLESYNVKIPGIDNTKLFFTLLDLRIAKQISAILRIMFKKKEEMGEVTELNGIDSSRLPPSLFAEEKTTISFEEEIKVQENLISKILTSFPGTPIPEELELHSRSAGLDFIHAQQERHDIQFILMIDDVHDLYQEQLELLKKTIEGRHSFPRWVATRKHIYPLNSLIDGTTGITEGREVNTLDIDKNLSGSKLLYRKFIKNLVEKRLKMSPTLSEFTTDQIEGILIQDNIENYFYSTDVSDQIKEEISKIEISHRFNCITFDQFKNGSISCTPLELEVILIKAHRFAQKRQLTLFPELSVDLSQVASKDKKAAEMFLKKRVGMPLGSGFEVLIDASNYNVEQFLRIFSPYIDRLIYRVQLDKERTIKPKEQHRILKKAAKLYMENIISKILHGNHIYRLVDNLGRFFQYRTYEPNAPHAPGITQFAIIYSDMELIKEKSFQCEDGWLNELIRTLTLAIANNVIVPENSQHQGAKGSEKKYVFSLNRLLCVNYNLPLQKGDFQLFSLEFLWKLCNENYKPEDIRKKRLSKQQTLWGD